MNISNSLIRQLHIKNLLTIMTQLAGAGEYKDCISAGEYKDCISAGEYKDCIFYLTPLKSVVDMTLN